MFVFWVPVILVFLFARWLVARALGTTMVPVAGSWGKRIAVAFAGTFACVALSFTLVFFANLVSGTATDTPRASISDVVENSPAARAGIVADDVVASFNGEVVEMGVLPTRMRDAGDTPVQLVVERRGVSAPITITVTPIDGRVGVVLEHETAYAPGVGVAFTDAWARWSFALAASTRFLFTPVPTKANAREPIGLIAQVKQAPRHERLQAIAMLLIAPLVWMGVLGLLPSLVFLARRRVTT